MLIAFWSRLKGQAGVSTNMLIISLLAALREKTRVMVCSSQMTDYSLERALVPNISSYKGETLNNYGFEPMMRYAKNGLLSLDNLSDFALPLIRGASYDLFMGTKDLNIGEVERLRNEELLLQILELSKKKYDLSFVDLENGDGRGLSNKVMEMADILVFNVNQSGLALDLLKSSEELNRHRGKAVFLIGRYDDGLIMNRKNIMRKYNFRPLAVIPYLPQLIDLLNRGELVEFMGRAAHHKDYMKKDFFQEVSKALETILQFRKDD